MIRLEITNLPAFQRRLKKLVKKIEDGVDEVLNVSASKLTESVKSRIAVKSGALMESIEVREGEEERGFIVSVSAPHARFVEFGTLTNPARPFLVPAAEEVFPKVTRDLADTLKKVIKS